MTQGDRIRVKDLKVPENIKILRDKEEIVALAVPPIKEETEKVEKEAPKEESTLPAQPEEPQEKKKTRPL